MLLLLSKSTIVVILFTTALLKWWSVAVSPAGLLLSDSARWSQLGLVAIESVLALHLIFWPNIRRVLQITGVLFTCFTLWTMTKAVSGAQSCGCLGKLSVSPWIMMSVDLFVLAAVAVAYPPESRPARTANPGNRRILTASASLALSAGIFVSGLIDFPRTVLPSVAAGSNSTSGQEVAVLSPEKWLGRNFPLTNDIVIDADLEKGRWIVVLHRPGCSACDAIHPEFEELGLSLEKQEGNRHVAFVQVPWQEQAEPDHKRADPAYAIGHLSVSRQWFVSTPTVILIDEGVVAQVINNPKKGVTKSIEF